MQRWWHENIPSLKHGHAYKQTVFAINLEKELRSDFAGFLPLLRFVKIDAEGYDLYVLRSMEGVISEYRPVIKAEVFKKTDRRYRQGMLWFFEMLDYTVYRIRAEPLERGDQLSQEDLDAGSHYDILALPNKAVHRTP